MGFKTFPAGTPLAAADVMTYLMKQANISCTSTTHPASPVAGMMIYETDTDRFLYYNGTGFRAPTDTPDLQAVQGPGVAQTLPAGTGTVLAGFSAPDYATLPGFNAGTGVWTCPSGMGGDYNISAQVAVAYAAGITRVTATALKNGASLTAVQVAQTGGALTTAVIPPYRVTVAPGDTLSVSATANGAASTTYATTVSNSSLLRISRVS